MLKIKTNITKQLERKLLYNLPIGTFGCFEVTIGFGGDERVDFMTINSKEIVKCYEIKVSKADFNSKAKHTFVGHYNYYVMPLELYLEVKDLIPSGIGVSNGTEILKRAKKQLLKVDVNIIKMSMIRSLYRDAKKYHLKY